MTDTTTTKTILRAEGFSCPSCVAKVEKRLNRVPGVKDAKVHYASARIEVDHAPTVNEKDLVEAVRKAGYASTVSPF